MTGTDGETTIRKQNGRYAGGQAVVQYGRADDRFDAGAGVV